MTKITCSREVTNMQERSNKHAGITCNREVTNMHRERRKTYCRRKKTYLGMMKNNFCQDINIQKMSGFLDEKYTSANMKNMHPGGTIILVKHAS
jgi:hypothetical protein